MVNKENTFPQERQALIVERLATHGRVLAIDLASEFGVSEHSVRRDLAVLAAEGVCKRVYGGAISLARSDGTVQARAQREPSRKAALGAVAAGLIEDGQHVFIDVGSTNLTIAQAIDPRLALTVTTNSPLIAVELMKLPMVNVILLGGLVHTRVGGAIDVTAVRQLQQSNFDLCFLGLCAIDADHGATAFNLAEAEFKRVLVTQSGHVAVAANNDKLASVAHYQVAACEEIGTLIVEHDASEARLQPIRGRTSTVLAAAPA